MDESQVEESAEATQAFFEQTTAPGGDALAATIPEAAPVENERLSERARRAVESLLENEALTADLDDAAAQVLLEWGVGCARKIAAQTEGLEEAQAEEMMSSRLLGLRQLIHTINRWAVQRRTLDAQSNQLYLDRIFKSASLAYGKQNEAWQESLQMVRWQALLNMDAVHRVKELCAEIDKIFEPGRTDHERS